MTGQAPPGWYRDPYGTPGLQRYFDGNQWTQATQPADEWGEPGAAQAAPAGQAPGMGQPPLGGYEQPQQPPGMQQPQPGWAPPNMGPGWGSESPPQQQYDWNAQAAGRSGNNNGLIWALAGGGGVLAVIIVIVVLFATGVIGGDDEPTAGPTPLPTAPTAPGQPPQTGGAGTAPVTGTVTDSQAGLSYSDLGGDWAAPETIAATNSLGRLGFTRGFTAVVQRDYNGSGSSYVASAYSGRIPSTVKSDSLENAAKNLFTALAPGSYPQPNTKQDLDSKAYSVSGKSAWYYKLRLSFPQAQANGWNFRTETIVVVVVNPGAGKQWSTFYVSIPDSHKTSGDLDLLVNSLRVL